jgi:hypothetical protein
MAEKRVLVRGMAERYRRSGKKEKGRLLDELVEVTGYNRSYATWLLNQQGRKIWVRRDLVVVGEIGVRKLRRRHRIYDQEVERVLKRLWKLADYLCGKRLVAALPGLIEALERHGELKISALVKGKLQRISASTIDRLLRVEKKKLALKARGQTKPGTLLRQQVAVRTYADWDEGSPGFLEVDLVAHEGGNASGDYAQTLDMTDVATGWTELVAVRNKAQVWVFEALQQVRRRLPFPLFGLDSDNGGEFINHHLQRYCQKEGITFTRSRPYRKNDNCYVEQKNYSVVRRYAGYARYDRPLQVALLNQLYEQVRLYVNFFLPSLKLEKKVRRGSRVSRYYGPARTPYQRVLESAQISAACKRELQAQHRSLNPAQLDRDIRRLQEKLLHSRSSNRSRGAMDGAGSDGKTARFSTAPWKTPAEFPTPPTASTATDYLSPLG